MGLFVAWSYITVTIEANGKPAYAFTDNTQLRFGLEERSFNSFREAANQVNLSRFYGGIHYMQGVEEGGRQGREIANLILKKL